MNNSLYFRKDNRSEEVFASNIYDFVNQKKFSLNAKNNLKI